MSQSDTTGEVDGMVWAPLLPADGPVEFPTMGAYVLRIRSRYDGNYECDVLNARDGDKLETSWLLTPEPNICICLRKDQDTANADMIAFMGKYVRILGLDAGAAHVGD